MSITLNYTEISNAEDQSLWSNVGTVASRSNFTDFTEKQGTQCIAFDLAAGQTKSGIKTPTVTAFDGASFEVGVWFLNPKANEAANEVIAQTDSGVVLRLYSGTNWADYNQDQHRDFDGTWKGGWLYLRASASVDSPDATSGTWGSTQVGAIDSCAVLVTNAGTGAANNGKNDTEYGVDWAIYYDKIIVTGYNGGTTPWTMQDIYDEAKTYSTASAGAEGEWGVIEQTENFFRLYCGLEFGDGTNAGAFESENEYIYLNQSTAGQDYDVIIKNNFTVTLGAKNIQTQETYAQNGTQFVAEVDAQWPEQSPGTPAKCAPNFTVQNGGKLNIYSSIVKGFGIVNLGSGGTSTIEFIKADVYDCDEVELRSTGVDWDNVRLYYSAGDEQDIGTIFSTPADMSNIRVFQVADGIEFRVTMPVTAYQAGDTDWDVAVLEGATVSLIDSSFNDTKIRRVT